MTAKIQQEFDRIALLPESNQWDHNVQYHGYLLRHIVPHCKESLDIGCGTGVFARELARRSDRVLALDLSPQMIRVAKERSADCANIDYRVADIMQTDLPAEHFDCIASIATLHHLSLEAMLMKMKGAVKVNGTIAVLDLFTGSTDWRERAISAAGLPASVVYKLIKVRHLKQSRAAQAAWDEHGKDDHYLTLAEVRRVCAGVLPGAVVTQHLLWRYSIIWKKDGFAR